MRADAAANRRRVLAAAGEVFAEQGPDASTEEIARRAGVGIGTVFRHFPTKRDLVESTLLEYFEMFTSEIRAVESGPDPAAALFGLMERFLGYAATKAAMAGFLFGGRGLSGPAKEASLELSTVIERLLKRAQESGGVRRDIGIDDFYFLFGGLVQPWSPGKSPEEAPASRLERDAVRQRALRVVFDGLRPREPR